MSTPTPITPRDSRPTSRSEREVFGTDSAMSASARQPNVVLGSVDFVSLPSLLLRAEPRGAHSGEPQSLYVLVAPYMPCPRTSAASALLQHWAVPQLSGPVSLPIASHHVFERRWRLSIAGFHSRRPAGCAWFHFFPRSVGFGPTDSCAKGAFTMAPSMLCHAQATPSRSSYSANPFRHRRTKTPLRFQSRKYLWIELALPNRSAGSAFHWHPVRNTYTIPSNTRRGSIGLRPPPGRRRYFRPFLRLRAGINGSAFAQSSSETIHERVVVMGPCCPIMPKRVNIIIYG
jgi:hypothetical protein